MSQQESARAQVEARYGVPEGEPDAVVDAVAPVVADPEGSVLALALDHRTVRDYLPEPLAPHVLPALVAAAQSVASSSNMQLWSVVAVTEAARKERLAALSGQRHVASAPLLLVFVADVARARAAADGELPATDYLDTTVVAVMDAGIAAQNAVLVAESLGLGTCYIGAIRNHPEQVAAELDLPEGVAAVVGLTVGHPDPARPAQVKPRLSQTAVLHHETYDVGAQSEAVSRYDERVSAFYASVGLPGGWADRLQERLGSPTSLHGRERLREALTALGLPSR